MSNGQSPDLGVLTRSLTALRGLLTAADQNVATMPDEEIVSIAEALIETKADIFVTYRSRRVASPDISTSSQEPQAILNTVARGNTDEKIRQILGLMLDLSDFGKASLRMETDQVIGIQLFAGNGQLLREIEITGAHLATRHRNYDLAPLSHEQVGAIFRVLVTIIKKTGHKLQSEVYKSEQVPGLEVML